MFLIQLFCLCKAFAKAIELFMTYKEFMDARPIAFFDSGVGGLTVFEKVKKLLPNENYLYFGDTKNVPYGSKSSEELLKFTSEIFDFFKQKNVKVVVMACNTTSATIFEDLKLKYNFKIYPIIQSCSKVIADMNINKIGVLATSATINSGAYGKELKKYNPNIEIFEQSCPPWVGIVEENSKNSPENTQIIKEYLQEMLLNNPEKIILGCTHYPYLLDILSKFAPMEMFIDPSEYFAQFIKSDLKENNLLNPGTTGSEEFFVSANPEKFKQAASMFYSIEKLPTLIK